MAAFGWRRPVEIEAALKAWCMEILLNVPGTIFGENGGRGFAAHPSKISPAPSEMSSENKIIFPGIFQETRKTFIFNRMKKQAPNGHTLKNHAEGIRKILSLSISATKNEGDRE